jgi:hypothetical protein
VSAALLSTMPALPMAMPSIDARHTQVALIYHAHLLAAAIETKTDARLFENPPRKRQIGRPDWDAVFKARRFAIYLTVTEYDRAGAYVARAAGLTKQAVSHLLREVEDSRDNPDTEALLARIAARAAGRKGEPA